MKINRRDAIKATSALALGSMLPMETTASTTTTKIKPIGRIKKYEQYKKLMMNKEIYQKINDIIEAIVVEKDGFFSQCKGLCTALEVINKFDRYSLKLIAGSILIFGDCFIQMPIQLSFENPTFTFYEPEYIYRIQNIKGELIHFQYGSNPDYSVFQKGGSKNSKAKIISKREMIHFRNNSFGGNLAEKDYPYGTSILKYEEDFLKYKTPIKNIIMESKDDNSLQSSTKFIFHDSGMKDLVKDVQKEICRGLSEFIQTNYGHPEGEICLDMNPPNCI
jgi:hypothetical protein